MPVSSSVKWVWIQFVGFSHDLNEIHIFLTHCVSADSLKMANFKKSSTEFSTSLEIWYIFYKYMWLGLLKHQNFKTAKVNVHSTLWLFGECAKPSLRPQHIPKSWLHNQHLASERCAGHPKDAALGPQGRCPVRVRGAEGLSHYSCSTWLEVGQALATSNALHSRKDGWPVCLVQFLQPFPSHVIPLLFDSPTGMHGFLPLEFHRGQTATGSQRGVYKVGRRIFYDVCMD